jgi:hypothetical protein
MLEEVNTAGNTMYTAQRAEEYIVDNKERRHDCLVAVRVYEGAWF